MSLRKWRAEVVPGTLFSVPLDANSSAHAVGLVTRSATGDARLSYFFGLENSHNIDKLRYESICLSPPALKVVHGLLGFEMGGWKIVCKYGEFKSEDWPLPEFITRDALDPSKALVCHFDEKRLMATAPTGEVVDFDYSYAIAGGFGDVAVSDLLRHILLARS